MNGVVSLSSYAAGLKDLSDCRVKDAFVKGLSALPSGNLREELAENFEKYFQKLKRQASIDIIVMYWRGENAGSGRAYRRMFLCFYAFSAHFLFPIMDMDEGLLLSLQLPNDPLDKSRD